MKIFYNMKKLEFTIEISAPKEKVWDALWEDANYRKWCATFMEGSHYESDFKEGSIIQFLSTEKDGMWGKIEKMIPFEKLYILHQGEVIKSINQPAVYGDDAIENYDLIEENGITTLSVVLNTEENYIQYFSNTFPKALNVVKQIAEQ